MGDEYGGWKMVAEGQAVTIEKLKVRVKALEEAFLDMYECGACDDKLQKDTLDILIELTEGPKALEQARKDGEW